MKRSVSTALVVFVVLVAGTLALTTTAVADSQARIVRLSDVGGTVEIDRGTGRGYERAIMNMPVVEGTRVWAREGGRSEIEFEDGSTIRLTPDSRVIFHELRLIGEEGRATTVEIEEGLAYFNLKHQDEDQWRVMFRGRDVTLPKSARFRVDVRAFEAEVAVYKGELLLGGTGDRVTVRKDETLTLNMDDPGRYFLAKGVRENGWDDWDREREQYRDRYARVVQEQVVVPVYGGVSDLNYYGRWVTVGGIGVVWRPFGVQIGWYPFNDGAWVWYPGSGYVWVSAYPWGWLPYRYGSWVYASGYGYCWQPGRNRYDYRRWHPVVPIGVARDYHPGRDDDRRRFAPPVAPRENNREIVYVGRANRDTPMLDAADRTMHEREVIERETARTDRIMGPRNRTESTRFEANGSPVIPRGMRGDTAVAPGEQPERQGRRGTAGTPQNPVDNDAIERGRRGNDRGPVNGEMRGGANGSINRPAPTPEAGGETRQVPNNRGGQVNRDDAPQPVQPRTQAPAPQREERPISRPETQREERPQYSRSQSERPVYSRPEPASRPQPRVQQERREMPQRVESFRANGGGSSHHSSPAPASGGSRGNSERPSRGRSKD